MLEPAHENPPQPPNPDLERIMAQLARSNAEEVIEELNNIQPDAKEIKNKVDREKEALQMHGGELPNVAKGRSVQNKLNNITDVIKRTVVAISKGAVTGDIFEGVPDKSKNVLVAMCTQLSSINEIGKINSQNSLFINEIIIRGIEGRLETTDDLISVFNNLSNLQFLHNHLYSEISELLQDQAHKIGATEEKIERLKTEKQKENEKKGIKNKKDNRQEEFESLKRQSMDIGNSMSDTITGLNTDSIKRSSLAKGIKEMVGDPRAEERAFKDKLDGIKASLIHELHGISKGTTVDTRGMTQEEAFKAIIKNNTTSSLITTSEISGNYNRFTAHLTELLNDGVLSTGNYNLLMDQGEKLMENSRELFYFRDLAMNEGRGGLYAFAENYIKNWSPRDRELLQVLDNKDAFLEFAKKSEKDHGYNGFKNPEDWQRFRDDIRGMFDTIFSATASNPKDFWDRSFNELTEGFVYKQLTTSIIKLGEDLKEDPEFGESNKGVHRIGVVDYYAIKEGQSYEGSSLIGGPTLTKEKTVDVSLGKAIGIFSHEMIDYKELRQYAHDVNALTEVGLGFDKLAEVSARLRMEDVMRMVKAMPGLSDAHRMYHENISMAMSMNARIVPVDFGRRSGEQSLDSVGWQTFYQLKSLNKMKGKSDKDIQRLIALAQGLSKGCFGGFFGAALENRVSVGTAQREGEDPEKGGDKDDRRPFIEINDSYTSTSDRGIEKMIISIDPDLQWRRFGLPRLWEEIRYAFAPRNLKKFIPNKEDYYSNHGDISKWNRLGERAFMNGRTNEHIDFEKDHKFLKDNLKTPSVDLALREGWRFYFYRNYIVYQTGPDGKPKVDTISKKKMVDFHKTIGRLEGVGQQTVKIFIHDLFTGDHEFQKDISDFSLEDIGRDIIEENRDYLSQAKFKNPGWNPDKKLNNDQKGALKVLFYDKYIFQNLRKTRPSHFIAMESRRWMPEDEVRGIRHDDGTFDKGYTFHDQLDDYLMETYGQKHSRTWINTNLLPMYVSALQTVEQNEWDKHKVIWDQNEKSGRFDSATGPFDYTFSESAFDDKENRKSLIAFYAGQREFIGRTVTGEKIDFLQDEQFITHLKGFYKRMDKVINMERWDHNMEKNKLGHWEHTGEKETLTLRYAKMLDAKIGNVDSYISWNLLNIDQFAFETGGNRGPERMFAETALIATKVQPELAAIWFHKLDAFTRKPVNDIHELEKSIHDHFAEHFQKLSQAVGNIDQDQGWEYCASLMMSLNSVMVKDRIYRFGGGGLLEGFNRRWHKAQSSFTTDKIPVTDRETATNLDSTGSEVLFQTLGNAIGMHRESEQVKSHTPAKIFNREVKGIWAKILPGTPNFIEHDKRHISIEDLVNNAQVGMKTRLFEQIPMLLPIFLFIMALLLKLAWDKDNKK